MPDIASIGPGSVGPVNRTSPVSPTHQVGDRVGEAASTEQSRPSDQLGDRVEVSDRARLLSRLRDLPGIRGERVSEVRQAIADESYLTDDKLDIAVNRLLDDLS